MAARLVLTFFLSLTAGLELPILLGIAGDPPLSSATLAGILTAVFGLLTGGILALLMGPGVQALIEGGLYRILLVETVLWWYERQRRQTSRNS